MSIVRQLVTAAVAAVVVSQTVFAIVYLVGMKEHAVVAAAVSGAIAASMVNLPSLSGEAGRDTATSADS